MPSYIATYQLRILWGVHVSRRQWRFNSQNGKYQYSKFAPEHITNIISTFLKVFPLITKWLNSSFFSPFVKVYFCCFCGHFFTTPPVLITWWWMWRPHPLNAVSWWWRLLGLIRYSGTDPCGPSCCPDHPPIGWTSGGFGTLLDVVLFLPRQKKRE